VIVEVLGAIQHLGLAGYSSSSAEAGIRLMELRINYRNRRFYFLLSSPGIAADHVILPQFFFSSASLRTSVI